MQWIFLTVTCANNGAMATRMAHEIQNPLNFVNNFSELSKDLVEEIISSDDEKEKKVVAQDLINNLEKIHHQCKKIKC